jgi:hypothetical protein
MSTDTPIQVNRVLVVSLWATVVAENLGYATAPLTSAAEQPDRLCSAGSDRSAG